MEALIKSANSLSLWERAGVRGHKSSSYSLTLTLSLGERELNQIFLKRLELKLREGLLLPLKKT
jgi:hypothetical protein